MVARIARIEVGPLYLVKNQRQATRYAYFASEISKIGIDFIITKVSRRIYCREQRHRGIFKAEFIIETAKCLNADKSPANDNILQLIVKYVPKIEKIYFETNESINRNNINALVQLCELKSLYLLDIGCVYPLITSLHEIASADIALESLDLGCLQYIPYTDHSAFHRKYFENEKFKILGNIGWLWQNSIRTF